ncbi:MAG: epoxyqueuosine reductase [Clostridia bacterium]|nr:epoxyqueuosine reductase [Clostridia bacterium]
MKEHTMLDSIRSLLGVPARAIPLSVCGIGRSYLLDRTNIPLTGTAILFAIPYVMTEDVTDSRRNLSLYAVPRDYHLYIRELETTLLPSLRGFYPHNRFALFSDHSPIREVDAAARAGLGTVGMHGLLITPEYGSFVFIGEILTDMSYENVTGETAPVFPSEPPTCRACGLCQKACPMDCPTEDKSRCLSALSQKKGELTSCEREALLRGGLAWGCDACQLACPYNLRVLRDGIDTPISFFRRSRMPRIDTDMLNAMTEEDFSARAYSWRGRAVITRNLQLLEDADNERRTP